MKTPRHLILALLLPLVGLHCSAGVAGAGSRLPGVVIPSLVIRDAPLTQAVQTALAEARRIDPQAGVLSLVVEEAPGTVARVSVDLKNVPLLAALHHMASSCFYSLTIQKSTLVLHPLRPGTPELETAYVTLQPHTLRQLHIGTLTEEAARRALQSLKIDVGQIDRIIPFPASSSLLIQGLSQGEAHRAASILELLNRGLRLER